MLQFWLLDRGNIARLDPPQRRCDAAGMLLFVSGVSRLPRSILEAMNTVLYAQPAPPSPTQQGLPPGVDPNEIVTTTATTGVPDADGISSMFDWSLIGSGLLAALFMLLFALLLLDSV